jgi:hypothetical protein
VKHIWEEKRSTTSSTAATNDTRASKRRALALPARLAWKDHRGVNRFASVVTRDISDSGVFVESASALSIPMYRLVQFQVEPTARMGSDLPESLRQGRILSAVYRLSPPGREATHGLALRLMVEPRRKRQLTIVDSELRICANS